MPERDLRSVYETYFPLIREKCDRMLRDREEAQDLAQETFVRLWRRGPVGEDPRAVTAWLYRTGTHLALDRLRKRRRRETAESLLEPHEGVLVSLDLESATEMRAALSRLAARIPKRELELAILHYADGLTLAEVAEIARISERTVRRLLQKLTQRTDRLRKDLLP